LKKTVEYETKVQVVENDGLVGLELNNYINKQKNIRLTGGTRNLEEALILLKIELPDVVVLDLSSIGEDGLALMKQLKKEETQQIEWIVLSDTSEDFLIKQAKKLGAKKHMTKPVNLNILIKNILEISYDRHKHIFSQQISDFEKNSINKKISYILLSIGIPPQINGYHYLREAIGMSIVSPEAGNNITKILYPAIADKFETSSSRAERAIRHAISVGWTRGKMEKLKDIFGYTIFDRSEQPKNGEFIAFLADVLRINRESANILAI
jgi:two-component system response regulator (stage 0 sporulation protein A)